MKYLKFFLTIGLVLIMAGCASSKQNPYARKKKSSYISTTQLGRNKYYFSNTYQKKLKKSYRKKKY